MSYIDDFIAANARTMTRDQVFTSLRGAGYDEREIKSAWRRAPRQPTSGSGTTTWQTPSPVQPAADETAAFRYIRDNRGRYSRDVLTVELLKAGHDRATIDAAWRAVEPGTARSASTPRPPFSRTTAWISTLVVIGIVIATNLDLIPGNLVLPLFLVVAVGSWLWQTFIRRRTGG